MSNYFLRYTLILSVLLLLGLSPLGLALIHGPEYPAISVSTVKIKLNHAHYLRSLAQWESYDSICSAAIVGVKPLTLITASHCLREVKLDESSKLPEVSLMYPQLSGISEAKIVKAFYQPYEVVANDITQDIAVLVFDATVDKKVVPLTVGSQQITQAKSLLICGFGKGYQEVDTTQPRCAERNIVQDSSNFDLIMPSFYASMDEMLHIKSQAQFEYTKELVQYEKALLAINRLDETLHYSSKLPMVTVGDSGGPWLYETAPNRYQVVAITSIVERFYNKSPHWSFFDRDTPLSDYPYIAYGLRLDHPKVLSFLKNAQKHGANLSFIIVDSEVQ